jgi:hypothetical protein
MTDTAIEQRDEPGLPEQREEAVVTAVVTALLAGRTVNSVRKQYNLTIDEIDRIIAAQWPVDNRARVRMIMTDLGKLDRLIAEFYKRALLSNGVASAAFATVAIKAMERKHELTGMEAAMRIDLQVTNTQLQKVPTRHEAIRAAILRIARPDWRPEDDDGNVNGNDNGAAPPDSAAIERAGDGHGIA